MDGLATDLELVERCREHDQTAWEQVLERYKRRVLGMAYRFTGCYHEAEDLTQDIFLKVFKSLETYDRQQEFFGWLAGITRNACIDHYRRTRRERLMDDRESVELEHTACPGPSPHGRLEAAERSSMVRRGLKELPPDMRTVLVLRDLMGLSYGEITEQLGLTEGTVKSRIHRGRLELAEKLRRLLPPDSRPKECQA